MNENKNGHHFHVKKSTGKLVIIMKGTVVPTLSTARKSSLLEK